MTKAKSTNVKATNAQKAIISAIETRITNAENANQVRNLNAELKFYNEAVIAHALTLDIDFTALASAVSVSDKKNANFVALYALQKVRKILTASAQNLASQLDGYTRTILTNLTASEQNNKSAYVSLSRAIEFNEFDSQKTIKARYNCASSTASTQASSTRQAFKLLNIASVTKNKVNDEFALNDSKLAKNLLDLVTVKK
jgi:hypothetical protein